VTTTVMYTPLRTLDTVHTADHAQLRCHQCQALLELVQVDLIANQEDVKYAVRCPQCHLTGAPDKQEMVAILNFVRLTRADQVERWRDALEYLADCTAASAEEAAVKSTSAHRKNRFISLCNTARSMVLGTWYPAPSLHSRQTDEIARCLRRQGGC